MIAINTITSCIWSLLLKAHHSAEIYSEISKNKTPVKKPGFVSSLTRQQAGFFIVQVVPRRGLEPPRANAH